MDNHPLLSVIASDEEDDEPSKTDTAQNESEAPKESLVVPPPDDQSSDSEDEDGGRSQVYCLASYQRVVFRITSITYFYWSVFFCFSFVSDFDLMMQQKKEVNVFSNLFSLFSF